MTSPLGWLKANAFQGQKPNGKDADDSDHGVNEDQLNKHDVWFRGFLHLKWHFTSKVVNGVFHLLAALSWTSELLGLNSDQVAEVLTHRSMILRGEEISTPLTVEQVSCTLNIPDQSHPTK